jgi:hypothetical protein
MRLRILMLFLLGIFWLSSFTHKKVGNEISTSSHNPINADTTKIKSGIKVLTFDLRIIPPSSGVKFYRDGIVFLSSSKFEEKMISNQISFWKTDARYAILKDSIVEKQQAFSPSIPFPYPCEAITFSGDYSTMFFTRYSDTFGTEKIFKAKFSQGEGKEGSWSFDETPLNFCADKYTYTHPALSADGKLLIFASNRPGSIGGMDLFASQEKEGTWSEPVNLGDAVNSTSNELFPFLDAGNNLFFSSDGVQGYGGYDIYVCRFKKDTWEKPINLGLPVNTRNDDVAFTVKRDDGKSAFYTVKQKSGNEASQLYQIWFEKNDQDTILTLSHFFTRPDNSKMVILVLEPAVQATDKKAETAESVISRTPGTGEVVTYRVQFMTSFNPRTRTQISVAGKDYNVFDYLYSGAYRLCVGEFSTLAPAIELQSILRKNDYPQANVIAFKNNIISFDPELLKEQAISTVTPVQEKATVAEPVPEVKKVEVVKPEMVVAESKKIENVPVPVSEPAVKKDIVVYRVQFLTNSVSKGTFKLTVSGKVYNTFEYSYAGAYRSTVGEFSTLSSAIVFQKEVRQSGYPQAFVVAFKNGTRSTDPSLFK